jgi:hypothetical protein
MGWMFDNVVRTRRARWIIRNALTALIARLTMAVSSTGKSEDSYVKATSTDDPLLERYPAGSKAPTTRPLPTSGYSWGGGPAERELMGSYAQTDRSRFLNFPCKLPCLLAG